MRGGRGIGLGGLVEAMVRSLVAAMKVLSQAPHALGIVLKRGRSQRPGIGKDQLYPVCQFRRQCWMAERCSSLSIVDQGVGRRRF